jgi:phage terminase Nu1 subunit (DNA packaging protein)
MSESLEREIKEIKKSLQRLTEKQVTRQELADLWEVDPVTIDNYRKKGLKRLKNGRFPLNESLDWLYEESTKPKK